MRCATCGMENPEEAMVCQCGAILRAEVQAPKVSKGMFQETDYLFFVLGIFIIGGLLLLPLTYGYQLNMPYLEALPWSFLSAAVFLIAFRKDGTFSIGRAIPAIAGAVIGVQIYASKTGKAAFAAGGFLGFIALGACGFAGIVLGRLFRKLS